MISRKPQDSCVLLNVEVKPSPKAVEIGLKAAAEAAEMIEEKQMTEMIPSGLIKISDGLVVRPSDITYIVTLEEADYYNTRIRFKNRKSIDTRSKMSDIIKKLSSPGHL